MSESEMTSWLTQMRGLFNIFLHYFAWAENGRREGVSWGVKHVAYQVSQMGILKLA
jgi:hypothetical protein